MTEWGQASAHWPHWMQTSVSQIGTSSEMLRFSHAAVPNGNVPSIGIALTGNSSPRPAMIAAVTRCTNAGADDGTIGGRSKLLVAALGTETSRRCARV